MNILQLELWLEPAWLGLITTVFPLTQFPLTWFPLIQLFFFFQQYLNKLSYLPGDVITNSEPLGLGGDLGGIGSRSGPGGHGAPFNTTSYTSPFLTGAVTTTAAPGGGISGINDLLAETTMYNSFSSGKTFKKFRLCLTSEKNRYV